MSLRCVWNIFWIALTLLDGHKKYQEIGFKTDCGNKIWREICFEKKCIQKKTGISLQYIEKNEPVGVLKPIVEKTSRDIYSFKH